MYTWFVNFDLVCTDDVQQIVINKNGKMRMNDQDLDRRRGLNEAQDDKTHASWHQEEKQHDFRVSVRRVRYLQHDECGSSSNQDFFSSPSYTSQKNAWPGWGCRIILIKSVREPTRIKLWKRLCPLLWRSTRPEQ